MSFIKILMDRLSARRRYREMVDELSRFSEHELNEMGIYGVDIGRVARQSVAG